MSESSCSSSQEESDDRSETRTELWIRFFWIRTASILSIHKVERERKYYIFLITLNHLIRSLDFAGLVLHKS